MKKFHKKITCWLETEEEDVQGTTFSWAAINRAIDFIRTSLLEVLNMYFATKRMKITIIFDGEYKEE